MKNVIFLLPCFFLVGCLKTQTGRLVVNAEADQKALLQADCDQIAGLADARELLTDFRRQSDRLLRLTARSDARHHLKEIEELNTKLEALNVQLASLLREEWTTPRWSVDIQWTLPEVIKSETSWDYEPRAIVFNGREWPTWRSLFSVATDGSHRVLHFRPTFSSLDICQTSTSLGVVLETRSGRWLRQSYRLILEAAPAATKGLTL